MQSVSDNIMLGQLCPLGTGAFSLLLDETQLADAIEIAAGFGADSFDERGGSTPGTCRLSDCCDVLQSMRPVCPLHQVPQCASLQSKCRMLQLSLAM